MLVTPCIVFFLLAIINANVNAFKSYSQYQLWRLHTTNNDQVGRLLEFSHRAHKHNVNFWSDDFRVNTPVNFII